LTFFKAENCVLCIVATDYLTFGQNKSYDGVLYQAVAKTAGKDINLAKKMADSLYKSSVEPLHKVKSLMLLSELKLTTGKKEEGINYAFAQSK